VTGSVGSVVRNKRQVAAVAAGCGCIAGDVVEAASRTVKLNVAAGQAGTGHFYSRSIVSVTGAGDKGHVSGARRHRVEEDLQSTSVVDNVPAGNCGKAGDCADSFSDRNVATGG